MTGVAADIAVIGAIGTMVAAIAGLIGVLLQGAKTRSDLDHARRDIRAARHEVQANSGSSMRDAVDRIEAHVMRLWTADERRARNADRIHREIFHRLDKLEGHPGD